VADDERPARRFLLALIATVPDAVVVGEADNGAEAVQLIEREKPDLAFLDIEMPEVDGMAVVRMLPRRLVPLIVFVTAYDDYAVKAFEVNAVDYLLKPVTGERLHEALQRARERLEREDLRKRAIAGVQDAARAYEAARPAGRLERIPVRKRDEIVLLPVHQIASIVADGELLHLTTLSQERHTISFRLKDLETRLDPERYIRLGRGTLVNIDVIARVTPLPGGTYSVKLKNGQELDVSRIQSRILRDRLLQL
jgi:two-component system LytT family response regulator